MSQPIRWYEQDLSIRRLSQQVKLNLSRWIQAIIESEGLRFVYRFIAPPSFSDEEIDRQARLIYDTIVYAVLAVFLFSAGHLIAFGQKAILIVVLFILIVGFGLIQILRRGNVQRTGVLLCALLWLAAVLNSYIFGGVMTPGFGGQILVVLIAGLILGGRGGLIVALLSIFNGAFLLWADSIGWVPAFDHQTAPIRTWFFDSANFLVAAFLLHLATSSIREGMVRFQHAEAALRESEERYALAVRGANDGLWDWNLKTGRVVYSPRWKRILGYAEDELAECPDEWFSRIHPDDLPLVRQAIDDHLQGVEPQVHVEHRISHRSGSDIWALCRGLAVRDEKGVAYRLAGSLSDVTARKKVEQRLRHEALHDALTDLPNRHFFREKVEQALSIAKYRRQENFAVLFLDLDRFKVVNDSLGHTIGDKLLVEVARVLKQNIRRQDTVARLGGDEFVILLDGIVHQDEVQKTVDRIQQRLQNGFWIDEYEVFCSASIGVVLRVVEYPSADHLLRDADIAMYRAKNHGRARSEIFTPEMQVRALSDHQLESDLRRAIEQDAFELVYQPIFSLQLNQPVGLEALLRWQHPRLGMLTPDSFIPLAEDANLMVQLGAWVLERACRQLAAWQSEIHTSSLTMSVNLSNRQLEQSDFPELVARILDSTHIEPHRLVLEITESTLMQDVRHVVKILRRLKEMGVGIHIDDFGTGYSSLSALHRLPIDSIKIDRSFVIGMDRVANKREIVRTIIQLGKNLKKNVVAEGIETEDALLQLTALGCEYGQGFLLGKPLPGDQVISSLFRTASPAHR